MQTKLFAFGLGVGTKNRRDAWLEVFYPEPLLSPNAAYMETLAKVVGYDGGNHAMIVSKAELAAVNDLPASLEALKDTSRPIVATFIATNERSQSTPETYLKLHLLSHRLVRPHGVDLKDIFKTLPNVAWTSMGAIDPEEVHEAQLKARLREAVLTVHAVDKFPRMIDYVVPSGVRIGDGARVRLGAYLGSGTTVMQEGFINFNAGTEGPNMVEGRISAGVFVGADSDLGGSSSTMGTLSGGNQTILSVGRNCLIGANAGIGISLGDDCTVEAGLYVTAGSKIKVFTSEAIAHGTVKARELSGKNNLLFRRNSLDGAIECHPNKTAIELNADLHFHN